jgi:hypothetical protein
MQRVIRHPEVPPELEGAALWYEERQPGLGNDFLVEYQATLNRILSHPERWRKIHGDNRQINFHRFPYAIVYSVRPDDVIYLKAVMHLRRRPFYWQHR